MKKSDQKSNKNFTI
jgi:hypothetical protein